MRFVSLVVVLVGLSAVDAAVADHRTVRRYPRVYGATGRPYGPTQSHYQYQRQYGRPWHGYGGSVTRSNYGTTFSIGYYPRAYLAPVIGYGFGYSGAVGVPNYINYGPMYGYPSPIPQSTLGNPFNNNALRQAQLENDLRWQTPLTLKPVKSSTQPKRFPSSPVAKLKSLHAQGRGDLQLHKQEYREAYKLYREATRQAPDRAEAQFRLAFSLVCLGQYQASIPHFKRGLVLDPALPATGISLGKLLGRDNNIAKTPSCPGSCPGRKKTSAIRTDCLFSACCSITTTAPISRPSCLKRLIAWPAAANIWPRFSENKNSQSKMAPQQNRPSRRRCHGRTKGQTNRHRRNRAAHATD